MNKTLFISIVIAIYCITLKAQQKEETWQHKMTKRDVSFSEIQKSFNSFWEGKEIPKGNGYKQFKRWEHFNASRLLGMDGFPDADITWQAVKQFKLNGKNSQFRNLGEWEEMGPNEFVAQTSSPGLGRVNVIKVSPSNQNVVYVGTPAGGLWKTENLGNTWTPLTDYLMSIGISGIAINPNNEDEIYIGTGDGDGSDTYSIGVLKSSDGGSTWNETGLTWQTTETRTITKLEFDPNDPSVLFASSNNGFFKTTDGGDSWTNLLSLNTEDFAFHPSNSDIIYAVSDQFYRSTDGGNNFESISLGLPSQNDVARYKIGVSLDEPDYVYLLAGDSNSNGFLGLYRSTNSGDTFSLRSNSPNLLGWSEDGSGSGGQAWYDLALTVDPNNGESVFVGGVNVWHSSDGGDEWEIVSHWVISTGIGYTHADIHFLSFDGNALFCGSDGGIYRSTNNGNSFTDLSDGLGITQFYRLGVSATDPDLIIAGSQDNGTFLLKDGVWKIVIGADGMECLINPVNEDRMVGSIYTGYLTMSIDGGDDWDNFSGDVPEDGAWVTPFETHPTNPNIIFAGYNNVWKWELFDGWSQISNFGGGTFNALRVAPSDADVIYASKGSNIYNTTNGGGNWDNITSGLPGTSIEYIEVHPDDPSTVYVALSGYSQGEKVYRSTDGATTWENISANLPNVPVNCVEYENGSNDGLYIGTDIGVFYTDNDLVNWAPFMSGLPNVVVSELEVHDATQKIRAATFGRGIWQSPLYDGFTEDPTADFVANRNVICEGESITFTDLSVGNDGGWSWAFEGGTPDISGDVAPVITYSTPGLYEVTLTVDNANGTGTETKTEYIQVIPFNGEPIPFIEDFESADIPNSEWFVFSESGVEWESNTTIGEASSNSVWLNNFNNPEDQVDELVSSTIDLSNATTALLTFYVSFAKKTSSGNDRLRIFVSKDCGENWSLRKTLTANGILSSADPTTDAFVPTSDQWNFIEITNILETFLVENFRVKFYFESDGGNNLYLDNINLTSVTGIEDLETAGVQMNVFPNPTNGDIDLSLTILRSSMANIYVTDVSGRKVLQHLNDLITAGVHDLGIATSSLSKGTYFVIVELDGKEYVRKLIKD